MKQINLSYVLSISSILWISNLAMAGIFEGVGTPVKTISASGIEVPVYAQGKLSLGGKETALFVTGAGIRAKKLGFLTVNVYAAVSYVDHNDAIPADQAIEAIQRTKSRVLQLTLLRDMAAEQLRGGFEEALEANGVDASAPHVLGILDRITAMPAKSVVTIAGLTDVSWGIQKVLFEMPGNVLAADGPNFADDFWRIWFGIPVDQGLATLKTALTTKP